MSEHGKILLVEDEPNIGSVMRLMLKRVGFEMEMLASGREALTWLDCAADNGGADLALIMSDYYLTDITGLDVFRHASELGIETAQMLISGDVQNETVEAWLQAPRRSFLAKPFTGDELLKAVKRAIDVNE